MRKPMITRTVITTNATCLTLNSDDALQSVTYTICGDIRDTAKALSFLRKHHPNDNIIKVKELTYTERMYGMSVEYFLANAAELDEERKPLDRDARCCQ